MAPEQSDSTDSDATITYTPPSTPKPATKHRRVAKFIFHIVGIEAHKDEAQVRAGNEARQCNFKCYLCKKVYG